MEKYKDVLEKAARKELSTLIFVALILLLIIVAIWVSKYLYFNKMKKKHPTQFASKKQNKIRRGLPIFSSESLSCIPIDSITATRSTLSYSSIDLYYSI